MMNKQKIIYYIYRINSFFTLLQSKKQSTIGTFLIQIIFQSGKQSEIGDALMTNIEFFLLLLTIKHYKFVVIKILGVIGWTVTVKNLLQNLCCKCIDCTCIFTKVNLSAQIFVVIIITVVVNYWLYFCKIKHNWIKCLCTFKKPLCY